MKKLLLKTMLLLCALIAGSGTMWATDPSWTHAFVSPEAISSNSITVGGATWSVSATAGEGSPSISTGTYSKTYGLKFGSSKSVYYGSVTFTTDYFKDYNVKSVTVNILNNGSKKGTLTAQQGATSIGSASSTFGTTWTDLTVNTNAGSGGTLSFTYSVEQAFYIHSITVTYTTGGGGGSDPSISADNVDIDHNDTYGSISYIVSNPAGDGVMTAERISGDWLTVGAVSAGSVAFTCSANTGDDRTATVRLTYTYNTSETVTKDVTVTQAFASKTYTLASSLVSGKTYVIASGTSGSVKIMAGQASNNRTTVSGTVSETTLTTTNRPAELVVYGPNASGFYTLYDAANGYLYAASNSSNYLKSQAINDLNGKWAIDIDGETKEATVVAQGSNSNKYMRFNSTLFSCYGASSSVTDLVYFFEKADAPVATTASVTLNGNGYATFATTTALDFLDFENASFSAWQITAANSSTGEITFSQIKEHVAAGKGIFLKGTAGATVNLNVLPAGGNTLTSNKLVGITSATAVEADTYYGLSGNVFKKVNAGTVPAGKALLPASEVSSAREYTFVFEGDETTSITENLELRTENAVYDLQGRKVTKPVKGGLYIVNGKKVIK